MRQPCANRTVPLLAGVISALAFTSSAATQPPWGTRPTPPAATALPATFKVPAQCDGSTDTAPAFNATLDAIRTSMVKGDGAWPIGHVGRLVAPQGQCAIKSTINMTGLAGSGFVADFWGTVLHCETNGTPCVDATGMGNAQINGLNIYGDPFRVPNVGLMIGRVTNDRVGAGHNQFEHPTITGYFSLTPFFNNQSETTLIIGADFENWAAHAFGAIWDGSNHFNVQSSFTHQTYPANTALSFNENTCIECIIGTRGAGSVPIWLGGTERHEFVNSYAFYSCSTPDSPAPAVVLYFGNKLSNDLLHLDIHFEDNGGKHNLTHVIEMDGAPMIYVHGLAMRDNLPEQAGSLFVRGNGVLNVIIEDADLNIGYMARSATWWDNPSVYIVSGKVYDFVPEGFVMPAQFSGTLCQGTTCTTYSAQPPAAPRRR